MTRNPDQTDSLVTLGRIGRVHGIKGWVKLQSFTDPPANICDYRHFYTVVPGGLRELEMDGVTAQGQGLIAHFSGFDNPEQARELAGLQLQVPREQLPSLPQGQYYWHQLEGLLVKNLQDQVLGRVSRMLETGAHDVLVVKASQESVDERERLIPWRLGAVIVNVDLSAGSITVDWGADFLA